MDWLSDLLEVGSMWLKCEFCSTDFDNDDHDWLRWNEKSSRYCCQECERKDEFYANGGIDDEDY
jgi:hypothetical protein